VFLAELKSTGVLQLLHQIKDAYDSGDPTRQYTACRYLAFLMTYRDFDYLFKDGNPLHVEFFLRPGVETSIAALQNFVDNVGNDKSIDKRVLRYTKRFLEPSGGARQFQYQLTKMQDYFRLRHNEHSKNKIEAPPTSS
jgi:hypothetical protein